MPPLNSDSIRQEGLHPDAYLSNFGISYMQNLKAYVADEVFPRIAVDYENDIYPIWSKEEDFRIDNEAPRRPGAVSSELEVVKAVGNYRAQGYAKHVVLADRELRQGRPTFDLEASKVERLTRDQVARRELRCAQLVLGDLSQFGANVIDQASAKWTDATNGKPLTALKNLKAQIYASIGVMPNRMLIGADDAIYLSQHPEFVDRYKYWAPTAENTELPPTILGMKPVIARGQFNTARRNPGKVAAGTGLVLQTIWGPNVILYYVEDQQINRSTKDTLTSFKSFFVSASSGVYRWYENARRATIIETEEVIAEVVTAPPTVGVLTNIH